MEPPSPLDYEPQPRPAAPTADSGSVDGSVAAYLLGHLGGSAAAFYLAVTYMPATVASPNAPSAIGGCCATGVLVSTVVFYTSLSLRVWWHVWWHQCRTGYRPAFVSLAFGAVAGAGAVLSAYLPSPTDYLSFAFAVFVSATTAPFVVARLDKPRYV